LTSRSDFTMPSRSRFSAPSSLVSPVLGKHRADALEAGPHQPASERAQLCSQSPVPRIEPGSAHCADAVRSVHNEIADGTQPAMAGSGWHIHGIRMKGAVCWRQCHCNPAHRAPTTHPDDASPPDSAQDLQGARTRASLASKRAQLVLLLTAGVAEADALEKVAKGITAELLLVTF
jgi:hypothetical protein